ncbi:hypothetical protein [Chitinimonas taiwanensis]|uniref:hypothetical protein n=1 Tax=Chitinimonas taiwanensis TaxID=240412 RepID=UPI0035B16D65
MKFQKVLLTGIVLSTTACTTAHLVKPVAVNENHRAEVLVLRQKELNTFASSMVFGVKKQDYATISQGSYLSFYLPPEPTTLFVRSTQADKPFNLEIQPAVNERICLKAYANPANLAKAFLPFTYYLSSSFLLERISCPSEQELRKLARNEISYEKAESIALPSQ